MFDHSEFGVVVPEKSWVPAPRYLLRRDRVLRWARQRQAGRLLEIGPGSGALLRDFNQLQWDCTGLDLSPDALELSAYVTAGLENVQLSSDRSAISKGAYDLVLACEVLEHIEEDQSAFDEWCAYLKPGGTIIISVPAHMKRWDATDDWAGHVRRYEEEALRELVERADCDMVRLECYGFPLSLLTTAFRARHLSKEGRSESTNPGSAETKTGQSGIRRDFEMSHFKRQSSWYGRTAIRLGMVVQQWFVTRPWGNGYLLWAQKR
ncbi:class I SAM-dependent methyltransferase [Coraliomargarita akajimensis]|uniref:Methyltransferase type 12 n=1 Tax=Coraliomargarita akajimensis (strain DSM 45221 / IAM 15411 / JCM 23193 / KCTC 12865 / 04OKA010-24) TaxID=583355 RepID=D5EMS4_CORAD|nr:class I SAM-dependent methyltransferase [Coraliomargarita akajimensis]ADE55314.1 Methyltransferase type 12 [Coraliomargarita akajimensis DSM 45221]